MCTCKTSENSIPANFSPKLELGEDALKNCLKEKNVTVININVGSVTRPLPFNSLCWESTINLHCHLPREVLSKLIFRRWSRKCSYCK